MAGMFDRLKEKLDSREQEGGISPLDLATLPPSLRKIMRLMLREIEMSYPAICDAMAKVPERDRIEPSELDKSLDELTRQFWLIRMGEGDETTYRVNLRRKAGSTLAGGIWGALETRIDEGKEEPPPAASPSE